MEVWVPVVQECEVRHIEATAQTDNSLHSEHLIV